MGAERGPASGRPLRICVDARIADGEHGGIQQFILGLAHGLSSLPEGGEEYVFLSLAGRDGWLAPHVGGRCRLVHVESLSRTARARSLVRRLPGLSRLWRAARGGAVPAPVASSDGTVERLGADVMHFTYQRAFLTRVPFVYHPHDLQHVHCPGYFTPLVRSERERDYRLFCEAAAAVAVASSWVKEDVVRQYQLPPEKVVVIPFAPPNANYAALPPDEEAAFVRARGLPERFVLYSAQTWPHKNHVGLLEALALLRARGLAVPAVFTGQQNEFFSTIRMRVAELGLEDQVRFLGFVTPSEMQTLYRRATAVVVPSLFEAGSFPLWEAMLAGVPAACSNVTSLPRQAGDGALLFDPRDPSAIAGAVERLWRDDALRAELARRGRENVARFSWPETARRFRALYRRVAGRAAAADEALLRAEPLL